MVRSQPVIERENGWKRATERSTLNAAELNQLQASADYALDPGDFI